MNLFIKLFVRNFRRGFATNSSSSHSFVYLKDPIPGHDTDTFIGETEFGWNDFMLTNLRSKLYYVLCDKIGSYWGEDKDATEYYEELKDEFPEFTIEEFEMAASDYGVDHQSRGKIDIELARNPRVVIFGGNDNDGDSQERAGMVASGKIDWDATEPHYNDDLPRDEFPLQDDDEVMVVGNDHVWRVFNGSKRHPSCVSLARHIKPDPKDWKTWSWEELEDVAIDQITLVTKHTDV